MPAWRGLDRNMDDASHLLDALATRLADHISSRAVARRMVGLGTIVSVSEAAALLPMGDARAREWLREEGLVSKIDGKEVVVWLAVVERAAPEECSPTLRTPRAKPRRLVSGIDLEEVDAWLNARQSPSQ